MELLREKPEGHALVTGNGGNLYKHAHGVYSGTPPRRDFQWADVKARIAALPKRNCLPAYEGSGAVESYTVMYQDDKPRIGHVSFLTTGGERTWVNVEDQALLADMARADFCERPGRITGGELALAA